MKKTMLMVAALLCACSNKNEVADSWSQKELELINGENAIMRVLTIDSEEDTKLLRDTCTNFTEEMLLSAEYARLAEKMVATVTSPEQDGVGIAGPQVGLKRRVVAVQRFDKDGEPFEVYPNIRITAARGEKQEGPEGCLSVPDRRGNVLRWRDINICYTKIDGAQTRDTTETVAGFTAVIFQHECDHLDGVLYIDHLQ